MCVRCWLAELQETSSVTLSLLPSFAEEVILPGERRTFVLSAEDEVRALEYAFNEGFGCLGQLLFHRPSDDEGTEEDGMQLAELVAPLLQIMEIREPDDVGGVPGCIWVEVKCMGRLNLDRISDDKGALFTASVSSVLRDYESEELVLGTEGTIDAVEEARRACCALTKDRLTAADGRGSRRLAAASSLPHELTGGEGLPRRETPHLETALEEVIAASSATVRQRGLDEAPDETLDIVHGLWGVSSEADACEQLASWAACAWLDGSERLDAFCTRGMASRLRCASRGLWQRQKRLAAEAAIRRAFGPAS